MRQASLSRRSERHSNYGGLTGAFFDEEERFLRYDRNDNLCVDNRGSPNDKLSFGSEFAELVFDPADRTLALINQSSWTGSVALDELVCPPPACGDCDNYGDYACDDRDSRPGEAARIAAT